MSSTEHKISISFQKGISRLAIDVGIVINQKHLDFGGMPTYVAEQIVATKKNITPTMDCVNACQRLVSKFGIDNTFIISEWNSKLQFLTIQLLNRSINGGGSFIERTKINPYNIIFCTRRSEGEDSKKKILFVPLFQNNRKGPRVALWNAGKGAIARSLKMTHLIDKSSNCLLSFMLEGHLTSLDQPSKNGTLIHFHRHAALPTKERIEAFMEKHDVVHGYSKQKDEKLITACWRSWILANQGWRDVLNAFGLADKYTGYSY